MLSFPSLNSVISKTSHGLFTVNIVMVLEDGREFPTHITYKRKRDVQAALAQLPKTITNEKAILTEEGQFLGTEVTYTLR